jgi:DNA-binding PadR family transcriptional regulator
MRYDAQESGAQDPRAPDQDARLAEMYARIRAREAERLTPGRQPRVPTAHLSLPSGWRRERVVTAEGRYRLRGSQTQALAVLGTFRAVRADELPHYGADFRTRDRDLRTLKRQGLIEAHAHQTPGGYRFDVLTLTDRGKTLLDSATRHDVGQRYYAGLVKPRELNHDLALYRMYRLEAARLEANGAPIRRVTIDAEIKGDYQRHVNKRAQEESDAREGRLQAREEFAAAHQLPIIDGHLEIPDMRIEYESPDGQVQHVDLELVTEHYRREYIAGKQRAGFVVYRENPRRGADPESEFDLERLLA